MKILIVGGDSEIARGLMKLLILEGHDILTTTRSKEKVSETKIFFDYTNESSYVSLINKLKHEKLDAALFLLAYTKAPRLN